MGGVKGGGGEVRKGAFAGNPLVGAGDGKIIPPVGLGDLPSEGWKGRVEWSSLSRKSDS